MQRRNARWDIEVPSPTVRRKGNTPILSSRQPNARITTRIAGWGRRLPTGAGEESYREENLSRLQENPASGTARIVEAGVRLRPARAVTPYR